MIRSNLLVSAECAELSGALRSSPSYFSRWSLSVAAQLMVLLSILGASPPTAAAQTSTDAGDAPAVGAEEQHEDFNPLSDTWKFAVGGGVANESRYPGSRVDYTRGLPIISLIYGRYYFGAVPGGPAGPGLGAYLLHTEHWAIGVDIGGDPRKARRATDDPILRRWGNIASTARGGAFATYTQEWLSVRATISDAVNHGEGVLATLGIEAKYDVTPRLTLSIGPEFTWADHDYSQTFFGVSLDQSEVAGIAPYRARAGLNTVAGSAGITYRLTDHWLLGAHASYGQLQRDAADSPVTTDKTQHMFAGFVLYRF